MDESSGSEHKFEELSKAIAEAVMNSKKVKKIVADIQKKEKICPQSFMVLVLKMEVAKNGGPNPDDLHLPENFS